MTELKTKSEMCKALGWSQAFFDSVPLPRYHIGKRDYYKLADVDAAIELTKQEPLWESTRSKVRRITISHSKSGEIDIEALRSLRKKAMRKHSTQTNAEGFC